MSGICPAHKHYEATCKICLYDRVIDSEERIKALEDVVKAITDWIVPCRIKDDCAICKATQLLGK